MQLMTYRLPIYADLMALLDPEAQETYKNIKKMRVMTSLQGYGLGLFLSLVVLIYNYNQPKAQRYSTRMMVCVAGATTFLTHYFYYVLSPKSDWMLNHLKTPEQTKEWLKIYKTMSWNYHISLLVGVLSAVALGSVFKCD
jgi:hypothetical protein